MSKDFLVCLGGGVESVPMLDILSRQYRLIVVDGNSDSFGAQWVRDNSIDGHLFVTENPYGVVGATQAIDNLARKKRQWEGEFPVAGVMCTGTDAPDVQATIARRLNPPLDIPTIGTEAAGAGRNKWTQLQLLALANLPIPVSKLVQSNPYNVEWEDLEDFDIIKPVAGRGARGVQRLDKENYKSQYATAYSECMGTRKAVVAQKYVEGIQVSTESIVYDGKIVFTCFALRNYEYPQRYSPYIIENGCDTPFHVSAEAHKNYNDLILRSATALGWNDWTIKGDLVLRPNGEWTIIELAPRLSGGLLSSNITPLAYNYNYVESFMNISTGRPPLYYNNDRPRYVSQRYLFPRKEWIGKRITYLPDNNEMRYYRGVGDMITPVTSHANRLGQVIAVANNGTQARERSESVIREVESQIRVE